MDGIAGLFRQWRRYPFAMAGPLASLLYGLTALAGLLSVLFVSDALQIWVGLIVYFALWAVLNSARRRFARRRNLTAPSGLMPPERWAQATLAVIVVGTVLVITALGLSGGWVWVVLAPCTFAYEAFRHLRWRARGYPGDKRWAVRPLDNDPS